MIPRKKISRPVRVGNLVIGGNAPVSVQGMTKTKTADLKNTLNQLKSLQDAGAEIIRLAIRDSEDLNAFRTIRKKTALPLVADIHFRSELALEVIEAGADKVRLNPGNIKNHKDLKKIIKTAKTRATAIRIGVNSGSLPLPPGHDITLARAMVAAAKEYLRIFESENFQNLVVSLKSSSVRAAITANRIFARQFDYPLHLGITESGRGNLSIVKSAIGIGSLLEEGIGNTIRVSLSETPEKEIEIGRQILQTLEIRYFYPEIISCPTCGRCRVDLFDLLKRIETGIKKLPGYPKDYAGIKIAVMGCEVNGPGEAAAADIGIAAGLKTGLLFVKGKVVAKIREEELSSVLLKNIAKLRRTPDR